MKRIKNYKLFESSESVESICKKYGIRNWTLNPDGTVDVDGNVNLVNKQLREFPLKFGRVTGRFDCSNNNLISLEGGPNWVGGDFYCDDNKLTNLEGSPNWIGGDFSCSSNNLTNLVGGPNWVGGDFDCSRNNLTNLEGCPEKIWCNLNCQRNKIISLEYYPTILTGNLYTGYNPINQIWNTVVMIKSGDHGNYLHLFDFHGPVRFEDGQWVCYRECLDNFFQEIGIRAHPNLIDYSWK